MRFEPNMYTVNIPRYNNVHQVLRTTEFLVAVLLELPIRTLLLSQRVSRLWKDTIANSTKLQQALFMRPIPDSSSPNNKIVFMNPLLVYSPNITAFGYFVSQRNLRRTSMALRLNRACWNRKRSTSWPEVAGIDFVPHEEVPGSEYFEILSPASWMNMFVTQPPHAVSAWVPKEFLFGLPFNKANKVRLKVNGLTLGEICEDLGHKLDPDNRGLCRSLTAKARG